MTGATQDKYPWTSWGDGKDRKILIVRLGSLGDVVHAIPAQQLLGSQLPQAEIHWLTEPPYAELLRHVPGIKQVWLADTKGWRKELSSLAQIRRLVQDLRKERYDGVFDFQGLLKSALLSRLTGTDCVAGFSKSQLREKLAYYCYTQPVEIEQGKRHQIEVNLDLVDPPRHEGSPSAAIPLRIPDSAEAYLDEQFDKIGIANPILLNPGAGWSTKMWAIERYAMLADLIEKDLNIPVLFTYGPGEENLIRKAGQATGRKRLKTFASSILELGALCRRSRLMVAGDTGPMHLAVALKTPVVALIGPGYPWRTGPFNPDDEVVLHESPCPQPYRRSCRNHFCMDISVDKVYQAVVTRLNCSSGECFDKKI